MIWAAVLAPTALLALFSAAEMAIVHADRAEIRARAASGDRGARRALGVLRAPAAALGACRVGSALCATASAIGVLAAAEALSLPPLWAVAVLILPLNLVLGRLVPQGVAQERASALAPALTALLAPFTLLLTPLRWALEGWTRLWAGPHGVAGAPLSREDLRLLLETPGEATLADGDQAIIRRIFAVSGATVEDVMVPLIEVVALPHTATCAEAANRIHASGRSRLPVYQERVDRIVGIVLQHDLLAVTDWSRPVSTVARRPLFVPETRRIDALLGELRRSRQRMAVAVDEYGGATGILTAEDLLEEIVGDIEDESDRSRPAVRATGEREWSALGRAEPPALLQATGLRLPDGDYNTVAGYLLFALGRVPRVGERVSLEGYELVVSRASERAILEVTVRRVP